jgi:hypothetical protein
MGTHRVAVAHLETGCRVIRWPVIRWRDTPPSPPNPTTSGSPPRSPGTLTSERSSLQEVPANEETLDARPALAALCLRSVSRHRARAGEDRHRSGLPRRRSRMRHTRKLRGFLPGPERLSTRHLQPGPLLHLPSLTQTRTRCRVLGCGYFLERCFRRRCHDEKALDARGNARGLRL